MTAQNTAQKAKEAADAAVAEMRKACGSTANLELDAATGEPVCKEVQAPKDMPKK
jgi:hypothetical protein